VSKAEPDPVRMAAFLEKADESLAAAQLLLDRGYSVFASSRAYYAVFYAANAALLAKGLAFRTHQGLISAVNLHLVKSGELPRDAGEVIRSLYEARQTGDYEPLPCDMPRVDGAEAVDRARRFVSHVRALLEKEDQT